MSVRDERSHEIAVQSGIQAASLMDSVLGEALRSAEEAFVKEWKATDDRDKQLVAWAKVQALPAVEEALRRIIAEGEYSKEVLRRRQ